MSLCPDKVIAPGVLFVSSLVYSIGRSCQKQPVYVTALVGQNILWSAVLHLHHSLFNME